MRRDSRRDRTGVTSPGNGVGAETSGGCLRLYEGRSRPALVLAGMMRMTVKVCCAVLIGLELPNKQRARGSHDSASHRYSIGRCLLYPSNTETARFNECSPVRLRFSIMIPPAAHHLGVVTATRICNGVIGYLGSLDISGSRMLGLSRRSNTPSN